MSEITEEIVLEWFRKDPEKIQDIIEAEDFIDKAKHGSVEIVKQDGKYLGVNITTRGRKYREKKS